MCGPLRGFFCQMLPLGWKFDDVDRWESTRTFFDVDESLLDGTPVDVSLLLQDVKHDVSARLWREAAHRWNGEGCQGGVAPTGSGCPSSTCCACGTRRTPRHAARTPAARARERSTQPPSPSASRSAAVAVDAERARRAAPLQQGVEAAPANVAAVAVALQRETRCSARGYPEPRSHTGL